MLAALLLSLALGFQDDVPKLIEQLRSDEFAEREAAQRALERVGMPALERLKAEADKNPELDLKIRLKTLIDKIPKVALLAKVYGPTRRVTLSAKNEKLGELFKKLGASLEEQIRGNGVDTEAAVSVALEEATLWEALDTLARASRTHYVYRKDGVVFFPGEAPEQPVVYYEQFRISVVEVKRIDYRAPGEKGRMIVVMPEVCYQRNLTPTGEKYRKIFTLDAIQGPAGKNAQAEPPPWGLVSTTMRREYALEEHYLVDPAAATFSIAGKATINFAQEHRELSLPLQGEPKEERTADASFKVGKITPDDGKMVVTLEIEVPDAGGPDDRFRGVWVTDKDGKRHLGTIHRMQRDGKNFKPQVWFPVAPENAKSIDFRWAMGLHSVEVPFLLRNVKVP